MENVAHFCPKCGAERRSLIEPFCGQCGVLIDPQELPPETAEPPIPAIVSLPTTTDSPSPASGERQRRRRLLVVGALTFLTFGLYQWWWIGATWAELKRELEDDGMRPFWHVLSMLVPIYGLFKVYDHFNTIGDLAKARSVGGTISGGLAVSLGIFTAVVNLGGLIVRPSGISAYVPSFIIVAISTYVVVRGQSGLNDYWLSFGDAGRVIPFRTHWLEWTIIGIGILFFLLVLDGLATQA